MSSATPTGSPIAYATTGAAPVHGVSALGLSVAGVIALVSSPLMHSTLFLTWRAVLVNT